MHRSILIHQHGVWMNQWETTRYPRHHYQDNNFVTKGTAALSCTRCWDSCTSKVVTNARQEKLWFQFSRWNTTRSAKYIYTIGLNPECKKMCSINWFIFYNVCDPALFSIGNEKIKNNLKDWSDTQKEYLYLYKYFVDVV